MQISPITNFDTNRHKNYELQNKNQVSFSGLTKVFKNKIFLDGQKDIEQILSRHPATNPVVGQIPNFLFRRIGADNTIQYNTIQYNTIQYNTIQYMRRDLLSLEKF